jgi:hypothetical protein
MRRAVERKLATIKENENKTEDEKVNVRSVKVALRYPRGLHVISSADISSKAILSTNLPFNVYIVISY